MHWRLPFIEDPRRDVQVVWYLVVMIVKSTLRASLLKGLWQVPRWLVARMWLDGFKSHLAAEALWVLMHLNETVCYHTLTAKRLLTNKSIVVGSPQVTKSRETIAWWVRLAPV